MLHFILKKMSDILLIVISDRLIGQPDIRARSCTRPQEVPSLAGYYIEDVVCGSDHTLALTSGGDVWAWGNNNEGQLGLGHTNSPVREPQLVPCLTGKNIKQVRNLNTKTNLLYNFI